MINTYLDNNPIISGCYAGTMSAVDLSKIRDLLTALNAKLITKDREIKEAKIVEVV